MVPDVTGGAWEWEKNNFPSSDLLITTARFHSTNAAGAGGEGEQGASGSAQLILVQCWALL